MKWLLTVATALLLVSCSTDTVEPNREITSQEYDDPNPGVGEPLCECVTLSFRSTTDSTVATFILETDTIAGLGCDDCEWYVDNNINYTIRVCNPLN